MHKPESVLENEMHRIHWDFEIKTDRLILARRPGLVIVNNKTCQIENFAVSSNHRVKIKEYVDKKKETNT